MAIASRRNRIIRPRCAKRMELVQRELREIYVLAKDQIPRASTMRTINAYNQNPSAIYVAPSRNPRALREYRALRQYNGPFAMSFKKAMFGWPFYAARNLMAYTNECRRAAGARKRIAPLPAILFLIFTAGIWAALWGAVNGRLRAQSLRR
jgi:hypothetical protein